MFGPQPLCLELALHLGHPVLAKYVVGPHLSFAVSQKASVGETPLVRD